MVTRLASTLEGRRALQVIDSAVVRARDALQDAMRAVDDLETRRRELFEARARHLKALAAIRIDLIQSGDLSGELDRAHRDAKTLLDAQKSFIEQEAESLKTAQADVEAAEAARATAADKVAGAEAAMQERIGQVEDELRKDPAYIAQAEVAREASAVCARVEQKLELARTDMAEKGEAFLSDPLFAYLWKRRFRTPDYRASPPFRWLDAWVASLCNYDAHHANFARLSELPTWLEAHLEKTEAAEAEMLSRLEAMEDEALAQAGVDSLQSDLDAAESALEHIEAQIFDAETRLAAAVARHQAATEERTGPAREAEMRLANALAAASFPDLRELASETLTLADDAEVDELVRLRAETLALELEDADARDVPTRRRQSLSGLEQLRRAFKRERLDSNGLVLKGAVVADVIETVTDAPGDIEAAIRMLKRSARRVRSKKDYPFPGRGRAPSPGVLGDILIEVAKQATRRRGIDLTGGPFSIGGRGRRTSIPRPKSSGSKRRGWRTGGGF